MTQPHNYNPANGAVPQPVPPPFDTMTAEQVEQLLIESAAQLERTIADAQDSAASLQTELDRLAAAVADYRKLCRRAWVWLFCAAVAGSFLGALLGQAAADAWPWLRFR